ncbi:glutamate--cysteine ligase [Acinetobacter pittii]|uniref:glutamate--cysteine ligase n=3 Tax=Acinetobacter TaxID=469 RepID=UPI001D17EA8A|nr:glutamate--cysteine ligase [Acinetobacter pittii]
MAHINSRGKASYMDKLIFDDHYTHRLNILGENLPLLTMCLRGIERECLRVTKNGKLALTPHPETLGSALTNELITTDYSESLMEFVTSPCSSASEVLAELNDIHRYVYTKLNSEYLWSSSMPSLLPEEERIPIAEYGSSNIGKFKHVYRKGLALRYGKAMQCIAGIHYNFSLPDKIIQLLYQIDNTTNLENIDQSSIYMGMIRNFHRYSWLLIYLFGASPAVNSSFLKQNLDQFKKFDNETYYLPYATSLRMSKIGYQSSAQSTISPCFDSLDSYIHSIKEALEKPYLPYTNIGTHKNNEWVQLNTNILQIENEYYSNIRPKRVPYSGERALHALNARGIQYVEIRCLDINPFFSLGIDLEQVHFLDAFLLFCALYKSPSLSQDSFTQANNNFHLVAEKGRKPNLKLQNGDSSIPMYDWAQELMAYIKPLANLLDHANDTNKHKEALYAQQAKIENSFLTPSSKVLTNMFQHNKGFNEFALHQSQQHSNDFSQQILTDERKQFFESITQKSFLEQEILERQVMDFDLFMSNYSG